MPYARMKSSPYASAPPADDLKHTVTVRGRVDAKSGLSGSRRFHRGCVASYARQAASTFSREATREEQAKLILHKDFSHGLAARQTMMPVPNGIGSRLTPSGFGRLSSIGNAPRGLRAVSEKYLVRWCGSSGSWKDAMPVSVPDWPATLSTVERQAKARQTMDSAF